MYSLVIGLCSHDFFMTSITQSNKKACSTISQCTKIIGMFGHMTQLIIVYKAS